MADVVHDDGPKGGLKDQTIGKLVTSEITCTRGSPTYVKCASYLSYLTTNVLERTKRTKRTMPYLCVDK